MSFSKSNSNRSVFIGALMILVGAFYLLGDFFRLPYWISDYVFSWPVFVFVAGAAFFTSRKHKATGIVLMILGGAFMVQRFYGFSHVNFQVFWPVVLIAGGVALLLRRKDKAHLRTAHRRKDGNGNIVDDVNVFGGGKQVVTCEDFVGGSVVSVFGGGEYDLRKAELGEGVNELEVVSIFGGPTFIVPSDWEVKNDIVAIFGGFSDSRKFLPAEQTDKSKVLRITGIVMFGGGEVKNV